MSNTTFSRHRDDKVLSIIVRTPTNSPFIQNGDAITPTQARLVIISIRVFPNPGSGLFNDETGNSETVSLQITDVTRRIFTSQTAHGSTRVDLGSNAAGVCYLQVKAGSTVKTIRIIKQ